MSIRREKSIRREIVRICKLMSLKGYICATEGNVSIKVDSDRILITPSGFNKSTIREKDIVAIDKKGSRIEGEAQPSSELVLHTMTYSIRNDIKAIIHAHPPIATALTVAGVRLDRPILPEIVASLGAIPTAPYATPTTMALAESAKQYIQRYNAILLERHGSVTVGRNLQEAYDNLERLELEARVTFVALLAGGYRNLPRREINKLAEIRQVNLKR